MNCRGDEGARSPLEIGIVAAHLRLGGFLRELVSTLLDADVAIGDGRKPPGLQVAPRRAIGIAASRRERWEVARR